MKMNLLYIFADQWRAHAVGAAGEDDVRTPHMDQFAAESMAFDNAISTYPLCSPHRASLLTGKYPYSCGIWTNCKTGLDEILMLRPQEITISDVLHQAGYSTAYIGKWHLDASEKNFYQNPESGALGWDAFTPKGERRHHFEHWYSYGAMDDHLTPHYWKDSSGQIKRYQWSPEHETDAAISYLKNRDKNKPFCMFVAWNPPHPPYELLPPEYQERYKNRPLRFRENVPEEWKNDPHFQKQFREYYGAIEGLDANFGRLMDYLRNEHLDGDTVVVLSADHGDCMGSHGLMGKNIWYEEAIKIPFYIRGPKLKPGHTDALLASQDHMPTLLDLLDAEIPPTVQGVSFAACARGERMEQEPDCVFLSMIPGMPDMVNQYRSRGMNHKSYGWRGLRTKYITYVANHGTSPGERLERLFYDNVKDPYQKNPVFIEPDDNRAVRYDRILRRYLKLINDPFLL